MLPGRRPPKKSGLGEDVGSRSPESILRVIRQHVGGFRYSYEKALKANGFPAIGVDGDFGRGTLTAVVAFQKRSGLDGDGIVGQNTADALGIGDAWPRF